jgi:hypothetical protein
MSKQQCIIIRKQDEGPLLSKEIEQHALTVIVQNAWVHGPCGSSTASTAKKKAFVLVKQEERVGTTSHAEGVVKRRMTSNSQGNEHAEVVLKGWLTSKSLMTPESSMDQGRLLTLEFPPAWISLHDCCRCWGLSTSNVRDCTSIAFGSLVDVIDNQRWRQKGTNQRGRQKEFTITPGNKRLRQPVNWQTEEERKAQCWVSNDVSKDLLSIWTIFKVGTKWIQLKVLVVEGS